MDNTEIFSMADKLKQLKEEKASMEQQLKDLNNQIGLLDSQLSDAMADAELDRFSRNGSTFYLNSRLFASPAAGEKDALMSELKKQGFGSLVIETVNSNTLSSFVKEQMAMNEDRVPEWIRPFINCYEKTTVGIRKG